MSFTKESSNLCSIDRICTIYQKRLSTEIDRCSIHWYLRNWRKFTAKLIVNTGHRVLKCNWKRSSIFVSLDIIENGRRLILRQFWNQVLSWSIIPRSAFRFYICHFKHTTFIWNGRKHLSTNVSKNFTYLNYATLFPDSTPWSIFFCSIFRLALLGSWSPPICGGRSKECGTSEKQSCIPSPLFKILKTYYFPGKNGIRKDKKPLGIKTACLSLVVKWIAPKHKWGHFLRPGRSVYQATTFARKFVMFAIGMTCRYSTRTDSK